MEQEMDCSRFNKFSRNTHTHTHTHIYIYIYLKYRENRTWGGLLGKITFSLKGMDSSKLEELSKGSNC